MKFKNAFLSLTISATLLIIACEKTEVSTATTASITALSCSSTTFSATPTAGTAFTGTATVPYTGGNGAAYAAGTAVASTGVTGLTATLAAGTLASGAGTVTFAITGTPSAAGTAAFAVTVGGQSCSFSLTVSAAGGATTDCSSKTGVEQIVCLADAFKATLSASQIATLQLDYTFANIKTWSNLPAAMSARKGLKFSTLSATQLAAAKALVEAMTKSSVANEGYDEVKQIWAADDWLVSDGKANSDYGSGNYYIAFFGTPSTTGTFEIMETGHHKTVANTYTNGALVAATPHFVAVEPISWTTGGVTYAPVSQETDAMKALLASLSATQLATAKSSSSFSDIILSPGKEWQFPTTYTGLVCSGLTDAQKTLAINVIKTYTNDIDAASAAKFLALYTSEIDKTYITYAGTGNMNTKGDYFRIDGPHVWIELSQNGGVIYSGPHPHSVWRDRVSDYAGTNK
ncbi:hypothetical protein GCM10011514_04590 [Emticicia aquatilis]|uniref:DUF3500 domain-containing protein n=1 Tax=Emticicia aquatilis TaxID=1537369 RepID=A0A917DKL9_9BACT|nr:DUF3500 domain-containing protein [Emticicia aquatilis]GGD43757.1 hypothetical protein GCM10011514_04590 [Emticicia aquatilis]